MTLRDVLLLPAVVASLAVLLAARLAVVGGRAFLPTLGAMLLYEGTLLFWAGVFTSTGLGRVGLQQRLGRLAPDTEDLEAQRRPVGAVLLGTSVLLVLLYRAIEAIT